MNIKVLDCTLRDGGYINDWKFSKEQTIEIIESLEKSDIDIVECGYLNDKVINSKDSTLFKDSISLDNILRTLPRNAKKVVMINYGDFDIENLEKKENTLIDGVRLAFHKKDCDNALKYAKKVISLGYDLYFQPMVTKNYTDLEFLELIEKVNELDICSFYIVDSFGSMTLREFEKYMILSENNLNKKICLGYHAHNNMQLAFSNAVSMCSSNINRDIIIDSSIYGIGRGAGNLNTELIADYLNTSFEKNYNILPLLEIIDEFLNSLMKKSPWGFSPAQYLSASFNCHPNYATYLVNKNTKHIVGIKNILEKLPKDNKNSFDSDVIENLYLDSILEVKSPIKGLLELDRNKEVLLIASGKSVEQYPDIVKQKIDDENYTAIALNHKPKFKCDYYFFTNQKRFDEFIHTTDLKKIVISSNIKTSKEIDIVLDFSKIAFVENKLVPNVAIVAINYLINLEFEQVELAGLDGYKLDLDNYSYAETSLITDRKALEEENNVLLNSLQKLNKKISIEFITPSIFKKDISFKTLGVIPARYKSSRFEGKPLCIIKDIPMIKRTYTQAKKSEHLDNLVVATDDNRIKEYCEEENIPVVMTSSDCLTGTDRLAEVSHSEHYDLYVNIQGDEPVIDPRSIDEVVFEFKKYGDEYVAYNLYKCIDEASEINSDTIIKVIVNEHDELMYMSRLGIPFNKSEKKVNHKKQVCVYGFTKEALKLFSGREKTLNEEFEDIEILRFLDMGYKVKMKETIVDSIAVDIPDDVKKVEKFLDDNGLD